MKSTLLRLRERLFHTGKIVSVLDSINDKLYSISPELQPESKIYFPDISHVLHDSRSAFLRAMPRVSGSIMSAGCAGTWYFNWVASRTSHKGRHIGIEFYSPKPDDLPENVDWIVNTVGNMEGVKDAECDLVFSGENLEHLWPEDVVGFFLESWRVLKPGAVLVVDSPNRLVTEPLIWSHPEHTIEFTPDEARKLAELSGFEVTAMKGIWVVRDPDTGRMLPLSPNDSPGDWPVIERVAAASIHPDHSLIWWMEARKTGEPRPDELKAFVNSVFKGAWIERSSRFLTITGARSAANDSVSSKAGVAGVLVYGPYMPLKAGPHSATFQVKSTGASDKHAITIRCDVIGNSGQVLAIVELSESAIEQLGGEIKLEFSLAELEFGIQARCITMGASAVECRLPVDIT
jgi:SAM-dependent methyltransferase